jgi:hypothetical protein
MNKLAIELTEYAALKRWWNEDAPEATGEFYHLGVIGPQYF